MTRKQRMAEAILQHGFKLKRIFPATADIGPVTLCKALRRIETMIDRHNENACSYEWYDAEAGERRVESAIKRLDSILGFTEAGIPVFVNRDPRGYALKIPPDYAHGLDIHKDWGGYGILAPDLS